MRDAIVIVTGSAGNRALEGYGTFTGLRVTPVIETGSGGRVRSLPHLARCRIARRNSARYIQPIMRDAGDRPLFGAELLPVSRTHPARHVRVRTSSEELVLAPTLLTDAESIASAVNASAQELRRFMPWAHHTPTPHAAIERLRRCEADYFAGKEFVMGLFRERPGKPRELLTGIGLHPRVALNPSALEVGYWTATPHARRGYATLAVRCVTVYAFDKLGATRVQVMCDESNAASRGVIEKCDFAFEGVLRNLTADPDPAHRAAGLIHTGRCRMYALFPDTFAAVPWAAAVRASMRYANLLGYE